MTCFEKKKRFFFFFFSTLHSKKKKKKKTHLLFPPQDYSFDVITNCVSVDYLTKPFEVFTEMARVARPGGLAICAFSNRMFPTKAVSLWTSTDDADHARIVASFFRYSSDSWEAAEVRDITRANIFGSAGDPMYVVFARKKK